MSGVKQIMLIDDEKLVHTAFKLISLRCGYDLISIYDYKNALEYTENPSLFTIPTTIFVDLMLGEMPGIDVIKQMRTKRFFDSIPIVLYTGYDFTDTEVIKTLNIAGILKKPCSKDDVLNYIKT